jgi:hypothetical protein
VTSAKKGPIGKVSRPARNQAPIVLRTQADGSNVPVNGGGRGKGKKPTVILTSPRKSTTPAKAAPRPRARAGATNSTVMETAKAIANNSSHRNHAEVAELIRTFEKGWIDEKKFAGLLQELTF